MISKSEQEAREERVAKAIYARGYYPLNPGMAWEERDPFWQEAYLDMARAAIAALTPIQGGREPEVDHAGLTRLSQMNDTGEGGR